MTLIGEAFVRIRPDTSHFQRETKREIDRFTRGALVGTGALGGLGRAAAFASTSFIGGAGLVFALKSTVSAAMESQRVASQLSNVLQQQGKATKANTSAIEARTKALSQMSGFDDELATQTFVNLLRATNNVSKALRDNSLAADIARARNIDLTAAAQLVVKAELGQAGALRRVGIDAKAGATSLELIDLLQRKFAGSAEAYGRTAAGAQERFSVAIENTQEIIGTALLPTITRYLNRATDWLNDTENQRRVQDLTNDAVEKATALVGGFADGLRTVRDVTAPLIKLVGGLEDAIRLLIIAMAVGKVTRFAAALGGVGAVAGGAAAGGLAGSAAGAATQVGLLRGALLRLGAIGVITVGIDFAIRYNIFGKVFSDDSTAPTVAGDNGSPFPKGSPNDLIYQGIFKSARGIQDASDRLAAGGGRRTGMALFSGATSIPGGGAQATEAQRIALALAGDPDNPALLRQQRALLQRALDFAKKRLGERRGNLKAFADQAVKLQQDITGITEHLAAIAADQAAKTKAAAVKAREAQKRQREAAREALLDAIGAPHGGTANAPGAFGLFQTLAGQQVGAAFGTGGAARVDVGAALRAAGVTGAIPEALSLRIQIAEANGNDKRLEELLQQGVDSLQRQLRLMKRAHQARVEQLKVEVAIAQTRAQIRALKEREAKTSGFTPSEFFAEVANEQRLYGSNVGAPADLSPQAARGSLTGGVSLPLLAGKTRLDALKTLYVLAGSHKGLLRRGNIDLLHRAIARNPDGSISTVRSFSIGVEGGEALIPQVVNGRVVSMAEAIRHYKRTGETLGLFDSPADADAYAVALHNQQAAFYGRQGAKTTVVHQHFYGERPAGQALQTASQAARALP